MEKINSFLPTHSLINFLICGAGILVFILLIIVPTQKTSAELDRDIEKINARIDEQRMLKPVFESLLKQVKKKGPTNLPSPIKAKLARGDINEISERLLAEGVRMGAMGPGSMRAVTHLDVDEAGVNRAADVFADICG